jgi:hypothetical protein
MLEPEAEPVEKLKDGDVAAELECPIDWSG